MEYNLILNFKRSEILQTDIVFSQGDYGKAMLRLSCRDDDVPITGAQSATISFSTPNGYLVTGELVGGDGEYSYTFKGNELQAPGRITATVSLKWADGRLSSCLFSFKCRAVQGGTAIDSGNYLTEVDQVVQEAKAKIAELQKLIDQLKPGIGSTALTKADLQNDLTQEQSGIKALDALQGKVLEKMLNDLSDKMSNELKTYVSKKQIINNLLSTVPGNVLDAMQGKALGDRLSKTEQSITQLNSDMKPMKNTNAAATLDDVKNILTSEIRLLKTGSYSMLRLPFSSGFHPFYGGSHAVFLAKLLNQYGIAIFLCYQNEGIRSICMSYNNEKWNEPVVK
jgi:hypothetical protein